MLLAWCLQCMQNDDIDHYLDVKKMLMALFPYGHGCIHHAFLTTTKV